MSPTLLSTIALLFVSYTHNVNASWRMRASTLISARMDPLIAPGGVAAHVHDIVGGNNFDTTYDFNKLRESTCSTVEIQEDKSNYWAPSLYYKHRDTGKFELVHSNWAVYYLHRGTEKEVKQFPEGFRMIAGSPKKTSSTSTDDDAFNFHCLSYNEAPIPETLELPKRPCPNGIRIQIMFQSCWNGKDATSANFKDHVSYPVGTHEGGTCPPSHPVRLMSVFLEQIADTSKYEYYDGAFVLSTGDNVGYSSHADFQNGWDASPNSVLQQAINTCTDAGANLDTCEVLKRSQSESFNVCRPNSKLPVEDIGIYGGLDKLPGDNAIWGGNVPKTSTGASNTPPFGSPFSTLPAGWVEHGCIDEGDPYTNTLDDYKFVDQYMYPGLCVHECNSKGFKLAGLQAGNECYCANEFKHNGSKNLIDPSLCRQVCPGNMYENCGGSRKINLYEKTGDSTGSNDGPTYPPVGSRFTEVYTSNGTTPPANVPSTTTSSSTQQSSNPPSNSTPGSNGSMGQTSTAQSNATPSSSAPSNATPTSSAPSTPTPSTARVCKNGKLIKRWPDFQKREPVKRFHVPARHRRSHH